MRLSGTKPAMNLLVVTWIVSWLLTIPLFHIHALDIQEIPLRSNSFLAHTVFSGDLPGEYPAAVQQQRTTDNQRTVESHYPRYSEIDFVALEEDDDNSTKRGIRFQPQALDQLEPQQSLLLPETHRELTFEVAVSPLPLYLWFFPSRAPPRTA